MSEPTVHEPELSVRGYLVVTVAEASGRNKDEDDVWDAGFYEGYVKGLVLQYLVFTTLMVASWRPMPECHA